MSSVLPDNFKEKVKDLPCSLLQVALDDELTIVSANDAFFNLIDYKADIWPKSIFKLVYSADIIYFTQQVASQKFRKDNQFTVFFRVLQKNGDLKWVMINGNKTEENIQIQDKSMPIYFCTAVDMTAYMTEYKRMEQEIDNHRTILELSRELFFEYLIATDTLSFSELFREVFNKESVIKNFSKKIEKTKIIHPEDLPLAVSTYRSMMGGKKQVRLELRMVTREGAVAWYVCYAFIIYDENKNPYKVAGKLAQINKCETDSEVSDQKIQLDPLTDVYTNETAQRLITHSMSVQKPKSLSALLLCEIQNFKGANELALILDNENILKKIASIFKGLLRKTDVVGRTGLGEFVIYMKDIGSERAAYDTAEQICREINNLYSYEYNKNNVYVSIGIAFALGKSDYGTTITNAKSALAIAKKNYGNSFEVFYPSVTSNS